MFTASHIWRVGRILESVNTEKVPYCSLGKMMNRTLTDEQEMM